LQTDSVFIQLVFADGHSVQACTRDMPTCRNETISGTGPDGQTSSVSQFRLANDLRSAQRGYHLFISFDTAPGDIVVHHARTIHGARANASATRRRRAISVRYAGDDVVYRIKPGAPQKPHHAAMVEGQPLDPEACPVVWPL
jgi:ectoine hydroxylase-related dioxygenase (phytanoyl-CoA dioxygenase family)